MVNPPPLTVLSLCTGYGGLELGLSRALENPLRVVAVEIEAYALANLVAKAEAGKLAIEALYPDLKTFPAERFSGCFDIVLAGYPCQPFSVAGKREGTEDPRHLWAYIKDIIEAIRPVYGFFENVPGHLTLGFPEVYCSLRDMGYSVEAGLFTASEVGAPHKRQRLFILANSEHSESRLRIRQEESASRCGRDRLTECGSVIPNADEQGPQEPMHRGLEPEKPGPIVHWPARPGQPQYEWEEPRVIVGNATELRLQGQSAKRRDEVEPNGASGALEDPTRFLRAGLGWQVRRRRGVCSTSEGQAQPIVGRAGNGPARRVDRLRLCGNGVVPAQAALAFRELMAKV